MKNVRKINLIYLTVFFGDALFSPFIALYFISIGLGDFERGILLALLPLFTILGNFVYGKLSGKLEKNINLLRILSLVNGLVIFFFGFVKDFYLLLVLTIIFAFHNNPYFSMQDGIGVAFCEKEKKAYSYTRIFGSMGYCIALLSGTFLVDLFNYQIIFIIAGIFFLFVNILLLFVKYDKEEEKEKKEEKISFTEIFKNQTFIRYIFFYLLLNGMWVIGESYTSTYFNSLLVPDATYSLWFGIQVGVEMAVIFLCGKFLKKDEYLKYLLIGSCVVIAFRYLLLGLTIDSYALLAISSVLRGIGWGGLLSSHLPIVKKILGLRLTMKGIAFLAIIANIIGSIGNFVAPYIYTNLSLQWLYVIFGSIQVIGIVILLTINFKFLKERSE